MHVNVNGKVYRVEFAHFLFYPASYRGRYPREREHTSCRISELGPPEPLLIGHACVARNWTDAPNARTAERQALRRALADGFPISFYRSPEIRESFRQIRHAIRDAFRNGRKSIYWYSRPRPAKPPDSAPKETPTPTQDQYVRVGIDLATGESYTATVVLAACGHPATDPTTPNPQDCLEPSCPHYCPF